MRPQWLGWFYVEDINESERLMNHHRELTSIAKHDIHLKFDVTLQTTQGKDVTQVTTKQATITWIPKSAVQFEDVTSSKNYTLHIADPVYNKVWASSFKFASAVTGSRL